MGLSLVETWDSFNKGQTTTTTMAGFNGFCEVTLPLDHWGSFWAAGVPEFLMVALDSAQLLHSLRQRIRYPMTFYVIDGQTLGIWPSTENYWSEGRYFVWKSGHNPRPPKHSQDHHRPP